MRTAALASGQQGNLLQVNVPLLALYVAAQTLQLDCFLEQLLNRLPETSEGRRRPRHDGLLEECETIVRMARILRQRRLAGERQQIGLQQTVLTLAIPERRVRTLRALHLNHRPH